ncbi:hypothetical protein GCM10010302_65140 [Streptomyces polychromogenes]|uniref:Uncharacterized protein n=1 Tax=Streptomyces polychromogenes TaxID=67342 RepID=A0ABN0VTN7_9ACTN
MTPKPCDRRTGPALAGFASGAAAALALLALRYRRGRSGAPAPRPTRRCPNPPC